MDAEIKGLLIMAKKEIAYLRQRAREDAKELNVLHTFMRLLAPPDGGSTEVDVVYLIEQKLHKAEADEPPPF